MGPKLPVAVCDCCTEFAWMRHEALTFCRYCKNGYYIWAKNFVFYECPTCLGVSLGCGDCVRGLIAVPREQLRTGEWVKFSEPDANGCVDITNADHNEWLSQALSENYPWA